MKSINDFPEYSLEDVPMKMGPWRHIRVVLDETGLSLSHLMNLIENNQIAFIEPKQPAERKIYLHRDWVDAITSKYPVANYCLLQRHLKMDDFTDHEWRIRISRRKPKELASDKQIATLHRILKSEYILEGERKWILPIFDEKWIGSARVKYLLEYFLGLKIPGIDTKWMQINEGVFELRRKSLSKFHETRKKNLLFDDDWF